MRGRFAIYIRVLLDWVEGSQPFFVRRSDYHGRLVDLIEGLITPSFPRCELRAFAASDNGRSDEFDPFATSPMRFAAGTTVVFSVRDRPSPDYGEALLMSDRAAMLSRWKIRLHQPARLPWIYEPSILEISSVTLSVQEILQLLPCTVEKSTFLVAITRKDFVVVDLDHWGEPDAVRLNPFPHSFEEISSISAGTSPGCFFLVADGTLYEGSCRDWAISPVPERVRFPEEQGRLCGFQAVGETAELLLLDHRQLLLSTPSHSNRFHFTHEDAYLEVERIEWLKDGSLIFSDRSQMSLWQGDLESGEVSRLIGPVKYPPLFFFQDKKGVVYVLEAGMRRLHLFLPPDHRFCAACGAHLADRNSGRVCLDCGAHIPARGLSSRSFRHWLDMDLSSLGTALGPICADDHLNILFVADMARLVALPFSRRDVWGESED